MALATILSAAGCSEQTDTRYPYAKQLLEEKYGVEFEVTNIYKKNALDSLCTMTAYPMEDETLLFQGEFFMDGNQIWDGYITRKIGREIEEKVKNNLYSYIPNCEIIVMTGHKTSDCNDEEITFEQFNQKYPDERYVFYVCVGTDGLLPYTMEKQLDIWQKSLEGMSGINGSFILYYIPDEDVVKITEYKNTMTRVDAEFERRVEQSIEIEIPIKNGQLEMTLESLEQKIEEQLGGR